MEAGIFEVTNRYDFIDLSGFEMNWAIGGNGFIVAQGIVTNLNIPAQSSSRIQLDLPEIDPEPGVEYYLNIGFITHADAPMLKKGHEAAWDQFKLPYFKPFNEVELSRTDKITLRSSIEKAEITGRNFSIDFDLTTGMLTSYKYEDTELIKEGLEPNFWRAPTDNDFGNNMPERLGVWKNAGAERVVENVDIRQNSNRDVIIDVTASIPVGGSKLFTTYTVFGNGEIVIDNRLLPLGIGLPDMPRFGMKMVLPGSFENMTWFGRGPHETYWDRKSGAKIGLFNGKVMEQYHPYIRPQENGNKTDVRRVALIDNNGTGFLVDSDSTLNVSAHHFIIDDLDPGKVKRQRHTYDLKRRDLVTLNLDLYQMGVGGDTSWGARTHKEYTIPVQEYSYRLRLRPFSKNDNFRVMMSRKRF